MGRRSGGHDRRDIVVEIIDLDEEGHLLARPVKWKGRGAPPLIVLDMVGGGSSPAAGLGDLALVSVRRSTSDGRRHGRLRRILPRPPAGVVGIYQHIGRSRFITSTSRREDRTSAVAACDVDSVSHDDLVLAEPIDDGRLGPPRVRITRTFGSWKNAGAISLAAMAAHGIPLEFPDNVLVEAEAVAAARDGEDRGDLGAIPLITIDDDDARDHDDAVFAEPDGDGWYVIVAIADVAHHVRPASALDREAYLRGNSVYFPDRVVPMLPETLSNDLCSLKPGVPRSCVAAHLWITSRGELRRWHFQRAVMCSRARLTYAEVEEHRSGRSSPATSALPDRLIDHLYGVFRVLLDARRQRGAFEIERGERKVTFDSQGHISEIILRHRLDSHRLIEELMIAANVAAARELASRGKECLFRLHDRPSDERLETLRTFLSMRGHGSLEARRPSPGDLARVLDRAAGTGERQAIEDIVLRCQALAAYSPHNIGHFGLALDQYCHFTSPIRRYADLLIHRALLGEAVPDDLDRVGRHLGAMERRAVGAERHAADHYVARWLAARDHAVMKGYISGLGRFGIIVRAGPIDAEGLVPARHLPGGPFRYQESRQTLHGKTMRYALGQSVHVELAECDTNNGSLLYALVLSR